MRRYFKTLPHVNLGQVVQKLSAETARQMSIEKVPTDERSFRWPAAWAKAKDELFAQAA